jgi:transposase
LQEDVRAVTDHTARLGRLAQELRAPVKTGRLHPVVAALQALRGVQCTVAITMVAAIGARTRFEHPSALMKFLGLVPSEYSSGARRQQGTMTKAGKTHARRGLLEGAWAYRSPAQISRQFQVRLENQPKSMQDISWKAQVRLCQRYHRLVAKGKHAHVVTGAIARA